jgi:hypothetical protein
MNKIFLTFILLVSIFSVSYISVAQASDMTVSQLVEVLITSGVIPADKAVAARAAVATLSQATTTTTTTTSAPIPYLQIFAPNGGETWDMDLDLAYQITWGSSSALPVNIALVPTSGAACNLSATPITSKNGSNSFKTLLKTANCYNLTTGTSTPLKSGSYKARVSYVGITNASSTVIKDESNAVFTLKPVPVPKIKITYPNGGEKLIRNTTYDVKYALTDQTDGKVMYLSLLDSFGGRRSISYTIGKSGIYKFKIPSSTDEGAYKIELKMTGDDKKEISDISDSFFWILSGL